VDAASAGVGETVSVLDHPYQSGTKCDKLASVAGIRSERGRNVFFWYRATQRRAADLNVWRTRWVAILAYVAKTGARR
jgi:hypothetical protein